MRRGDCVRGYSVLMVSGLFLMLVLGLHFSASLATVSIEAEVSIHPEVFNLKRNGTARHGVITARISNLTKEGTSYDVEEIDVSTLMLYHETTFVAQPLRTKVAQDALIAKFDATIVANYIWFKLSHMGIAPPTPPPHYTMTFTIKGEVSGEEFAGSDTINTMLP